MTSPQGEPQSQEDLSRPTKPPRWPWMLALVLVAGLIYLLIMFFIPAQAPQDQNLAKGGAGKIDKPSSDPGIQGKVPLPPPPSPHGKVVEVTPGGGGAEQAQRKKPFGLDKSLDAVVRSDESIRVGDQTIKVADLERKLNTSRGELSDQALGEKKRISAWGMHLVRKEDNLWFIHLRLLREYMGSQGVKIKRHADKPDAKGRSTGVGKILKFAENMVGVYNLKSGQMTKSLDLLEPGEKVIVFNLSEIFEQLAKIDPQDLSGVMYDGRVLLLPERTPQGTNMNPVKARPGS